MGAPPAGSANEKSHTALRPPNYFDNPETSSTMSLPCVAGFNCSAATAGGAFSFARQRAVAVPTKPQMPSGM